VIRQRLKRWFDGRMRPVDQWRLNQRNVYIVPTTAGFAFCGTLLLLLVASINYQLNLGYLLTFLLAGSALASMHQTHATLRGLTLHARCPQPAFAGGLAKIEVHLLNPGRQRHGIGVGLRDTPAESFAWCDVPAQGRTVAHISFVPDRRGRHPLPALRAETRFPLGLFKAWTLWRPAAEILVYPRPEESVAALPAGQPVAAFSISRRSADGAEFEGVRAYRRADTMRQVVWKKAAQTGELVSRDSSVSANLELWLDYAGAQLADPEARLSRLTAWAVAADRLALAFGLRLPGVEMAPALGDLHRRAVLEALAVWR
jgi:uncharacterized protein (DUF58 family)